MMVNVSIQKSNSLQHVLRKVEEYLSTIAPQTLSLNFVFKFQEICLESVWSETETAERVLEMIQLLFD
jgi:sucrose synthase